MTPSLTSWRDRFLEGVASFGLARWIIVGFLGFVWIVAAVGTNRNLGTLLGDCLVKYLM